METSPFQGNIPGAPPPPPEVKVRTMRSDLESMARSGGGAPRFENVAVAGLAVQNSETSSPQATEAASSGSAISTTPSKSIIGPVLVVIVALVALAVVGYFAYTILSPSVSKTSSSATATP